jgi:hypothetical protein
MTPNQALTQEVFNSEDNKFEEEWLVIMNTKGEYTLSKVQARILQQAIAQGNRGIVMFNTFAISIPYIAEFYRTKRYLIGVAQLPPRATEPEYKPIDPKLFEEWKKNIYSKLGKKYEKK